MSSNDDDLGICPACGTTDRDRRTPLENFVADAGLLVAQAVMAHPVADELRQALEGELVTARLIFDERRAVVAVAVEHVVDGSTVPVGTYDLSTGELIPAGPNGSPD